MLPFNVFLCLADKYETRVETKGGSVCIVGLRKILISTTVFPKDWWPESRQCQKASSSFVHFLPKQMYFFTPSRLSSILSLQSSVLINSNLMYIRLSTRGNTFLF